MRILIFHGYLLGGTGSNVYNARLAEALVGLGHEVHLLCQERHPEQHAFVDAAGDWDERDAARRASCDAGARRAAAAGAAPSIGPTSAACCRCTWPTATRASRRARSRECSDAGDRALRRGERRGRRASCSRCVRPQLALANHLVMGPVILARALAGRCPTR